MNSQLVRDRGWATVIDLRMRRARDAASCVSARVHPAGVWMIVKVAGEMDVQTVAMVADLVDSDTTHVVLDLRMVTFIDAIGLGLMVGTQRRALEAGGGVRLFAPSRSVRKLLMLTGCARMFRTFDSLDQAVFTPVGTGPISIA